MRFLRLFVFLESHFAIGSAVVGRWGPARGPWDDKAGGWKLAKIENWGPGKELETGNYKRDIGSGDEGPASRTWRRNVLGAF